MTDKEYIEQRLDDQINWYSKKSITNQRKFKFWQIVKIIAALSIPVLTLWIMDYEYIKYYIGILGAFIALTEGLEKLFKHREIWTIYRLTSENLKREKILFQTKVAPYNSDNAFELLVKRSEDLMHSENQSWENLLQEKED